MRYEKREKHTKGIDQGDVLTRYFKCYTMDEEYIPMGLSQSL